jgi:plastocyanin
MTTRHRLLTARPVRLLAAIGGLVVALLALAACAHIAQAATTAEGGAKVSIANFAFTPGEITIAPGESVTWTNDDGAPHGLEFHDGVAGTDLLLPGASFSRKFDRPGTYDYNCSVHPYMTGRVVVRAQ